jgi:hypothetical protein
MPSDPFHILCISSRPHAFHNLWISSWPDSFGICASQPLVDSVLSSVGNGVKQMISFDAL